MTVPKGWTQIDASTKAEISKHVKETSMVDMLVNSASQVQLMVMDFSKMNTGFADNVNVVDGGANTVKSDADLEGFYKELEKQFAGVTLDHKLVKFTNGPALCYWGTIKQPNNTTNDLIGYAMPGGDHVYIISFSTLSGKAAGMLQTTESVMQTVKFN